MNEHQIQIINKIFSVIILIIMGAFVFGTASFNLKTKTPKILSGIETAKTAIMKMSEMAKAEQSKEEPEIRRKSNIPVKNIKKAFQEITLMQLDEAERTADGSTTQYWESDLIFFGRVGEFTLYGMNEDRVSRGLIIRRNDSLFFTDEYYLAPGLYYPRLYAQDFDGDGEKEAIILLHRLTGTGFSVEELFLLDETEQERTSDWKLYQFAERDYLQQLEENLSFEISNDNCQVHLFTADKSQDILIDLSDELTYDDGQITMSEDRICVGDIVAFYVEENTITISFTIGLHCEDFAIPLYATLPLVEAKVSYQNGEFKLGTLKFVDDTDS